MMYLLTAVACMGMIATSCSNDDNNDGDDNGNKTKTWKVKTMALDPTWGDTESWEFVYNTDGKVSKIYNAGPDWKDTISFDYSTTGKVTYKKGGSTTTCLLNAQGFVSELQWNSTEGLRYEYDATTGFITKITEYWDGGTEVKCVNTVKGSNIDSIVYKPENTPPSWNKVFNYSSGENLGGIQQIAQQTDNVSDWQAQSGLFGKACKNICTKVQKSTSSTPTNISFTFDAQDRINVLTRAGSDWSEIYTFTYYEED